MLFETTVFEPRGFSHLWVWPFRQKDLKLKFATYLDATFPPDPRLASVFNSSDLQSLDMFVMVCDKLVGWGLASWLALQGGVLQ